MFGLSFVLETVDRHEGINLRKTSENLFGIKLSVMKLRTGYISSSVSLVCVLSMFAYSDINFL